MSREEFYDVDPSNGEPLLLEMVAVGYGNDLGCILRDSVSINKTNIRDPSKHHLATLLITKLHKWLMFPQTYNDEEDLTRNLVNTHALGKFIRTLAVGNRG
jgi:hypothetical protein